MPCLANRRILHLKESTYGFVRCSRSTHYFGCGRGDRLGGVQLEADAPALAKVESFAFIAKYFVGHLHRCAHFNYIMDTHDVRSG